MENPFLHSKVRSVTRVHLGTPSRHLLSSVAQKTSHVPSNGGLLPTLGNSSECAPNGAMPGRGKAALRTARTPRPLGPGLGCRPGDAERCWERGPRVPVMLGGHKQQQWEPRDLRAAGGKLSPSNAGQLML